MTHVLAMFDSEYLHAYDLPTNEVVVTIERVTAGELTGPGGRKSKKPIVAFAGAQKTLALNKTNAKTIMSLYGPDVSKWGGKKVTLFKSTTSMNGETVECIRIKPQVPK